MRIGFVQIDTTVGAFEDNARAVRDGARRAEALGAELVIAPELAIPGYPPRDLLFVSSFVPSCIATVEALAAELPSNLPVLVGSVVPAATGTRLANAAVLLRNGRVEATFAKTLLPTYDVFDERRYFEPGTDPASAIVEVAGTKVGVVVCEDGWNDGAFWPDRRYDLDPVELLVQAGAEVIVNLSASPFAAGKPAIRRRMFGHAARRHGVAMAFVNLVGGNDGLVFDGGSLLYGSEGELRGSCSSFAEDVAVFDTDGPVVSIGDVRDSSGNRSIELADIRAALVLGIRDYFRKVGAREAVIGLSGGIDSALVATLAAEALGPSQVTGLAMPSQYSSDHSVRDAEDLARRLGIHYYLVPIAQPFDAYRMQLRDLLSSRSSSAGSKDLTEDNLQARIRGATLMAFSNRTGAIVLTTGNKSECAVGYCTLYGDTCGGLSVIGDLFKVEVYALARHINEMEVRVGRPAKIPESSLTKPPSAELRPNQTDQDDLPPYEVLDRVLEALIERELGIDQAALATGEPRELVADIARRVRGNEYKRRQFPPTIRVSDRAWVGREYPIVQRFSK